MKKFILFASLFTLLLSLHALDLNSPLPMDPTVKIGKLDNGLTYYLKKNSVPENKAELRLVVNAGSVLEDDNQVGLAHFCEHMAFNGTKNFAKSEMTDYLASIGLGFAGGLNAYTSMDETVYMLKSSTNDKAQLKKSIFILSEWANKVSFDDDEIEKERGVIIEEWRGGRGANERISNKESKVILKDSKYAERSPIGTYEIISTFKPQTIKKFYKDWYRPDLQAVVVVGDINIDEVESYIIEYFASIPKSVNPRTRVIEPVPDHTETLVSIESDKELSNSSVTLYIKSELEPVITIQDYKRDLTKSLFYSMFNNRLQELTKKDNSPFLYAITFSYPMVRSKNLLMTTAAVKDNEILSGFEAIAIEKERIDRFGFTNTELERAKIQFSKSSEKRLKEIDKQESERIIWSIVSTFLRDIPLLSEEQSYQLYLELLPLISLEDVNLLIKDYSKEENRVITASYPEKAGNIAPKKEDLLAILSRADKMELEPYQDDVIDEPLITDLNKPGKIISKKYNKTADLYELYLSNGAKVVYKVTNFKNDEILFDSYSPGGLSQVDDQDVLNGVYSATFIDNSGFGAFDSNALTKYLAGKNVRTSTYINNYYEGIRGSSSPEDFEVLMQLIYSYFTQVRKDQTAFNALKSKYEGLLQNKHLNPEDVFADSVEIYSYNNHPRVIVDKPENIKELDLEKTLEIYKDRFADASDFTFFFVGSIDPKVIEDLAEKYLASLPSLKRKEKVNDLKIDYIRGIHDYSIKSGLEQKSKIQITLVSDYKYSVKANNDLQAMNLILNEKLRENIREEKSGVYYVYAYPEIRYFPKSQLAIHIILGCSPDRVDELTTAIYEQIDLLKNNLPDEKYMQIYRQTMAQNINTSVKRNNYWLNNLKSHYQNSLNLNDFINSMDYVNAVKPENIRKAAQKYLQYDKNRMRFVLLPLE